MSIAPPETVDDIEARLGSNRFAVSGHPGLRFSPDGARIASNGSILGLWDVASGERVACAAGPSDSVAPGFAPDGTQLISGSDDTSAAVWRLAE